MSATFQPVGWTRAKVIYDAILILGIIAYMQLFFYGAARGPSALSPMDEQSLLIRAYGTCAFLLMTLVLMIGPLTRLDRRFLPLLYNRRHFGVITCTVSAAHLYAVIDWYLAFSTLDPWVAMLAMDASFGQLRGFPYLPFGIAAFAIMLVLAVTSHDFWLSFLTPPVWKRIHLGIYLAYALVVFHVLLGALQDAQTLGLPLLVGGSAVLLSGVHLLAAWRDTGMPPQPAPVSPETDNWIDAGPVATFMEGRSRILTLPGDARAAIFMDQGKLFAISNICAHQNGPLGEGKVIDGRVVCPWHGYEYRLRDGCAPAPYTERVVTYRLKQVGERVMIDPVPLPLGGESPPLQLTRQDI